MIFEPLNLRLLARRLSQLAHRDDAVLLDDAVKSDVVVFFQIFHLIFILEKVPLVPTLSREFLGLWTAVRHFSGDPDIAQYVAALGPLALAEGERIVQGVYAPRED